MEAIQTGQRYSSVDSGAVHDYDYSKTMELSMEYSNKGNAP